MDRGCLLAVQGEGMFGEDYQVFLSDGRAVGQVLVLEHRDPAEGGKQGSILLKIQSLLFNSYLFKIYSTVAEMSIRAKVCSASRFELWTAPEMELRKTRFFLGAKNFHLSLFAIIRVVSFCFV